MILYHGSRGGIEGEIKPISRERCDFGKGFYMGTNPKQAKAIVVEDSAPYFYKLNVKLSEIPEDRILKLEKSDWIYTVLANRKKLSEFNKLSLAHKILKSINNYDIIIGAIADDRMNEAMQRFSDYGLTDQGLIACLQSVDYGYQVVAKSEYACSKITILEEKEIFGKEADELRKYTQEKRLESRDIVKKNAALYQRKGYYLNEIIEQEQKTYSFSQDVNVKQQGNEMEL